MSSNRIFTSTAPINASCFNFDHSDNQKLLPKIPNSPFKIHLTPQSGKAVAIAAFNRSENVDTNTVIQSTWAAFSAMPNAERNLLLKGLIHRCSTNQVEYICTQLNLKGSEASQEGRVTIFNISAILVRTGDFVTSIRVCQKSGRCWEN